MIRFKQLKGYPLSLGITDRTGGVSQGVYGGMNTNFYNETQFETACKDVKIAIEDLGLTGKIIIATRQTHSNHILKIDENTDFESLEQIEVKGTALSEYKLYSSPDTDALMTQRKDVILMTFYADCVPLYIYDPINEAIAIIHSGWRGTSNKIADDVIKEMKYHYQSEAKNFLAGIGQSAGKCCYEVDEPVKILFKAYFSEREMMHFFESKGSGKYFIDLKKANELIFLENGLQSDRIEINPACTICESDLYHSHRKANGGKRGSMSQLCQLIK
ncbi:peptidoglycan editing factor PgeF [Fusibacter sp. 3D3]|uniref:peptidoglycan editing factor PgeF n=1 Tax=Fusibacter sp. 3D3 TaxID=1048380 RepID=UPI00158636E2|nr:peptidoglycan editing factor PgeF [Fusibacter sp. 3D3]